MQVKAHILIPVYNDWKSCKVVLEQLEGIQKGLEGITWDYTVVDDGSTDDYPASLCAEIPGLQIIRLNRNVGHQRAIALGLCHLNEHSPAGPVVVMDGDGEDKPLDVPALLNASNTHSGRIVFGQRKRRFESIGFRFFYTLYKWLFLLMTGQRISFGNFCVIPADRIHGLVHVPDLWNHFSGSIIRSKIPYTTVSLDRGKRIDGHSKMNFISLVIHGLSAIAVYTDMLAVRVLLISVSLILISLTGILTVTVIRFFTPLAIPGWASFVVLGFLILIFQAFLISLFLVFNVLSFRTQRHFIPAMEYTSFIREVRK